jgi:hypothetical protein
MANFRVRCIRFMVLQSSGRIPPIRGPNHDPYRLVFVSKELADDRHNTLNVGKAHPLLEPRTNRCASSVAQYPLLKGSAQVKALLGPAEMHCPRATFLPDPRSAQANVSHISTHSRRPRASGSLPSTILVDLLKINPHSADQTLAVQNPTSAIITFEQEVPCP